MSLTLDYVFEEALGLSEENRILLTERLLESIPPDKSIFEAQIAVAQQRGNELESGQITQTGTRIYSSSIRVMTFEFHPDALAEYEQAGVWYEERRYHLDLEFLAAVETAIDVLLKSPERYQQVGNGVRVFRLKRFPYNLFFKTVQQNSTLE
jgi:toxin ParE1/3/4